jgi:hypothetical protein
MQIARNGTFRDERDRQGRMALVGQTSARVVGVMQRVAESRDHRVGVRARDQPA